MAKTFEYCGVSFDDLYAECEQQYQEYTKNKPTRDARYWAFRFAARAVAWELLDEAKRAGVTPEQWEKLRKVASLIAYD